MKNHYTLLPDDLPELLENVRGFLNEARPEHKRASDAIGKYLKLHEEAVDHNKTAIELRDVFEYFDTMADFEAKLSEFKITLCVMGNFGYKYFIYIDGVLTHEKRNIYLAGNAKAEAYEICLQHMIDNGLKDCRIKGCPGAFDIIGYHGESIDDIKTDMTSIAGYVPNVRHT